MSKKTKSSPLARLLAAIPDGDLPEGAMDAGELLLAIQKAARPLRQTPPPQALAALQQCLESFRQLADQAGDVSEWNEGGHAHEAANMARLVLDAADRYTDPAATFTAVVLEIMETDEDWGADTMDRIAEEAIERGLAHTDAESMFKVGPQTAGDPA